jgi:hypothetical protein
MNTIVLLNIISKTLGISTASIKSFSRKRDLANARHITIYMLRNYTGLSLSKIGKMVNRHHTTVMHSIKVTKIYQENESDFKKKVIQVKSAIEAFYIGKNLFWNESKRIYLRNSCIKRIKYFDIIKKNRKIIFISKISNDRNWRKS